MIYFYCNNCKNWRCYYLQELIYKFIKPDLLILVPVLFCIGNGLKKSNVKDNKIPIIVGVLGILFSFIWIFSTTNVLGIKEVSMAIFAGFSQGILIAGGSVFFKQLDIQAKK